MKSQLLDIYHKAKFNSESLGNGDWLVAGWDRENQIDFIQIWFGDMDAPIVSYEKLEGAWKFCAWAGCDSLDQEKLDQAIIKSLITNLKRSNTHRCAKAINGQMSLF